MFEGNTPEASLAVENIKKSTESPKEVVTPEQAIEKKDITVKNSVDKLSKASTET